MCPIFDFRNIFLLSMTSITFILISAVSGIFLFVFLPGALALLLVINFKLKKEHSVKLNQI